MGTNGPPPYSPDLVPSDFQLFLHLKKFLVSKRFDDDDLKDAVQTWLTLQAAAFFRVYKNLCPTMISASILAANMWKNSLKNVESDNNKILYETLLNFSLQWNGTYFLNKPRINNTVLGNQTLIIPFSTHPKILLSVVHSTEPSCHNPCAHQLKVTLSSKSYTVEPIQFCQYCD